MAVSIISIIIIIIISISIIIIISIIIYIIIIIYIYIIYVLRESLQRLKKKRCNLHLLYIFQYSSISSSFS